MLQGSAGLRMLEIPYSVEWLAQSSQRLDGPGQHVSLNQNLDRQSAGSKQALTVQQETEDGELCRADTAHSKDRRIPKKERESSVRSKKQWGKTPQGALESPVSCGVSASLDRDSRTEGWADRRRLRTVFTGEQLRVLELSFQCQQYPGSEQRRNLAGELHLSETQVKTWFQNRRMKLKQQLQDARAEAFKSRLFLQYFSNPYVSIQSLYPMTDSSIVAHFTEFGPHHTQTSTPLCSLDHRPNLQQNSAKATPCRFHPYLRI
ncbi:homeobox protein vex1-like [Chiloscyllium plagiosum]|uniref:homeobox protein vex1-like n=1 Tax=Chiloscyllium plagiosum TaxID=36176 RepID=UPI001CB845DC|nr:homeobox protein vex1-like [Chiloscyllium plagiosum]XP_043568483.1 homeobox protein vex1-like [Chiloscyllium plagiosum]XP_043568484.1 homeobox protein vex1-like [Chiloscyllium plagiosum]XP_043568485.1 homeobox protein vex1-like [Chiloscyllium plagiosum]